MAESSNANKVPKGTRTTFGSWACTANGSNNYTSRLIAPNEPETVYNKQDQLPNRSNKLGRSSTTRASSALNSESVGNDPAPIHLGESVEPDDCP